jgi:hypothetical protein
MPLGRVSPLVGGRSWRGRPSGRPPRTRPVDGERTRLSRPIGPLGVISAPRNSRGLPESRSRESRPTTRRPLNLTAATAGGATHRPAVRRPDPSALLAGTPTRISRSNRVGPSGQLSIIGAQEVAVKAAFPLARRVCPAHVGWNYLHGISGDEPRLGPKRARVATGSVAPQPEPWHARSRPAPECGAPSAGRLCPQGAAQPAPTRTPFPMGFPGMRAVSSRLEPHAGPSLTGHALGVR